MIPPYQWMKHVIRPTLKHLAVVEPGLGGSASEQLMLGTAIAESGLEALEQMGGGPALSMFQIEPATFEDIYYRYLQRSGKELLQVAISELQVKAFGPLEQLGGNRFFACGIARIKFWMAPEPLPHLNDLEGMGAYYKEHYNTAGGAGSGARWADLYRQYVKP